MSSVMLSQADLQKMYSLIVEDEAWQKGLEDDERRICLNFAFEQLILAHTRGWDMERAYTRIMNALNAFRDLR
jgi:hypothetical protein